jgi:hypothetical protein
MSCAANRSRFSFRMAGMPNDSPADGLIGCRKTASKIALFLHRNILKKDF